MGKVSSVPREVLSFQGGVSCRRDRGRPIGLTLIGRTAGRPSEPVALAFSGPAPETLPETLDDPTVEYLGPGTYRITSAPLEWLVEANAVHLHRDVGGGFYAAVPPRPVPWKKRLFWRVVLALAATHLGKRLLLSLRGRRS